MPTKAQHWEDGHKVNPVNETDGSRSEQIAATLYAWDATLGAYVRLSVDHPTGNLNVTGGGTGGGGAATIADGADVAQGTTSDSAWVSGSGTVISLLKKIASAGGSAVSVADGADVAQGTTTDTTAANTVVGILKAIKAAVQGTLTVATHAVTQSGVWTVARSWTLSSATDSVNVGNFPASQAVTGTFFQGTQPVSLATNTPDVTDRAARLLGHVTVDSAPTTAVTGTFFQATQPVSIAATVAENVTQVGGVAVAATAKGTQGANLIPTQDAKDAGRVAITLFLDAVTGITTEALGTMSINKGGVAQTAATSYTVTAGKTFRISGLHTSVKNTSTLASDSRVRVRQAASGITVASPIILLNEGGTPAAVATAVGTDDTVMPDGYEIAGGQQIAISHIESATTCTVSVMVVGYEY